jgi:hypothetical protein
VGPAALPGGAGQHRPDGGLEALVGVGDHQGHTRQTPGHQTPQKRRPARPVFDGDHLHAQHLALAPCVDPSSDHHGHVLDPAVLADALHQGIDPDVAVGAASQGPVAERLHHRIQAGRHGRDPGPGDPLDAQRLDDVVHPAG